MHIFSTFKSNKILKNIMGGIMFIVLATSLVLSVALYMNYESLATNMVKSYTVEGLSQLSYTANFMNNTAKTTIMQYYLNPDVNELMSSTNLSDLDRFDLLGRIDNIRATTQYTSSIYI